MIALLVIALLVIALLVIALGDGQNGPYRTAPVPWQEHSGPCEGREGSIQREALNPVPPVPQSQRLNQ